MLKTWISSHKALIGAVVTALVTAAAALPPPYHDVAIAIGILLAAVSGGPKPAVTVTAPPAGRIP